MNKTKTFIGIDVSKKTFDAALFHAVAPGEIHHRAFEQSSLGYTHFAAWACKFG